MKIDVIHEHHVDTDLLPACADILDIGCRGFGFSKHFADKGHTVVSLDIDDLGNDYPYHQIAIAGHTGGVGIDKNNDPQATKIKEGVDVPCFTLDDFNKELKIKCWDLIKIDVEGAEKDIIFSLEKAPAIQLSIEFHLHTGAYNEYMCSMMVDHLISLGYEVVSHELTAQHGAGLNYWSSLFILK